MPEEGCVGHILNHVILHYIYVQRKEERLTGVLQAKVLYQPRLLGQVQLALHAGAALSGLLVQLRFYL